MSSSKEEEAVEIFPEFVRPDLPNKCKWSVTADPRSSPHTLETRREVPKVASDILQQVGNTPMVRLNRVPQSVGVACEVYAKCEFFNPGGSVKDRIAMRMIADAERAGTLKPGYTLIEPTSGNTGIGLALISAVKGYRCIIVMSEKMSKEKVDTLLALGAEVVRTPITASYDSPDGFIAVTQRLAKEIPNSVILDQYRNPSNPTAHYDITAEEILDQCDGCVDMVVMGAGTGGTVTGVGRKLKEKCPSCIVVGVDPEGSLLSHSATHPQETSVKFRPYEVEGIGNEFPPTVLDPRVVDRWYRSNDKDSFRTARRLIKEEGILCGGSSGAAMSCALKAAVDAGLKPGQKCVVVLPDGIRNYMSKFMNDEWMSEREFLHETDFTSKYWWWNNKVSDLKLTCPMSVLPTVTIQQAIDIMKKKNFEQLPIVDRNCVIHGMVTRGSLLNHLVTQRLNAQDPVEAALFRQFQKVTMDDTLGRLSHILRTHHFVVVIKKEGASNESSSSGQNQEVKKERVVGIVTQIDMLAYITSVEETRRQS